MEKKIKNNTKKLTGKPSDNLMRAIFGKLPEEMTSEEKEKWQDKLYEMQANSVTDEQFKEMCGRTHQEHTDQMMIWTGWCDTVARWNMEHGSERKYHSSSFEPMFSMRQVVDMMREVYEMGRQDAQNGVSEYDRLYKLNKEKRVQKA